MKSLLEIMYGHYSQIKLHGLESFKNKTVLITGASGLIGSNLVAYLHFISEKEKLNLKIIAVTKSKVEPWMTQSPSIVYLKKNLVEESLDNIEKLDYIIHCATYGQPKKFLEYPKETVMLNINTLFSLLELAKKHNATLLYPSSSEIYGEADDKHIPTDETYYGYVNTLSERAIYAESKRLAESICYTYAKKLTVKIARLLICYGPGVKIDDQRVYCEFIKKAQNKGGIVMMDEGLAQRTLCFVSDAIEMLLNILTSSKEYVYNVAGQETVTIRELAQIIGKINNAKVSSLVEKREITGTPNRSALSNKKYVNEFKKTSFISIEEGMRATSEWFKTLKT